MHLFNRPGHQADPNRENEIFNIIFFLNVYLNQDFKMKFFHMVYVVEIDNILYHPSIKYMTYIARFKKTKKNMS